MRALLALLIGAHLIVAAATLAACGDGNPNPPSHRDLWEQQAIDDYDFVYAAGSLCGVTRVQVEVRDNLATSQTVLEQACITPERASLTVDAVFDELAETQRSADAVQVTYDPTYGFPARVGVDAIREAIDDEYFFGIEEFTRNPP